MTTLSDPWVRDSSRPGFIAGVKHEPPGDILEWVQSPCPQGLGCNVRSSRVALGRGASASGWGRKLRRPRAGSLRTSAALCTVTTRTVRAHMPVAVQTSRLAATSRTMSMTVGCNMGQAPLPLKPEVLLDMREVLSRHRRDTGNRRHQEVPP